MITDSFYDFIISLYASNVLVSFIAWKGSVFRVFMVRTFLYSVWIWIRKTPNTDTFHAVISFICQMKLRERRDSYLKIVVKLCSVLHRLNVSMQPWYFKGASTLQRIVIWASWKVHHLWRVIKYGLLKGYKQLLSIKLLIQCTFL